LNESFHGNYGQIRIVTITPSTYVLSQSPPLHLPVEELRLSEMKSKSLQHITYIFIVN